MNHPEQRHYSPSQRASPSMADLDSSAGAAHYFAAACVWFA